MTEDQAKTKWCPFARVILDYDEYATSANRGAADESDHLHKDSRCIGSACMAWRETRSAQSAREIEYREKTRDDPLGQDESKPLLRRTDPARGSEGYCGLAAKPEFGR